MSCLEFLATLDLKINQKKNSNLTLISKRRIISCKSLKLKKAPKLKLKIQIKKKINNIRLPPIKSLTLKKLKIIIIINTNKTLTITISRALTSTITLKISSKKVNIIKIKGETLKLAMMTKKYIVKLNSQKTLH